jgi:uncharacterized protein (TIGR03382 family)
MYAREDARLQRHFSRTLTALSRRDTSHLTRAARSRRERMLRVLAGYAARGRFPRNPDHARHTPYFIDAHETRCAMAHLIEQSGDRDLVERVARTRNNAFVRELAADLSLRAWLEHMGLTAREAAQIQPAYCFITKGDACFCQSVGGSNGVANGTVTAVAMANRATVMVEATHGDTGAISIGDTIEAPVYQNVQVGDEVLVSIDINPISLVRVTGTTVELQCTQYDVPELAKSDAISAMLATSCEQELSNIDSTWGESQCYEENGDGCSAGGGVSPFVAVFAAALWARRFR